MGVAELPSGCTEQSEQTFPPFLPLLSVLGCLLPFLGDTVSPFEVGHPQVSPGAQVAFKQMGPPASPRSDCTLVADIR